MNPVLETHTDETKVQSKTWKWADPAVVAILAAALGLFGNLVVAWMNNSNTRSLAERKLQTDLLMQATNTNGDLEKACKNLSLFISTNLLKDPEHKITRGICTAPVGEIPLVSLPRTGESDAGSFLGAAVPSSKSYSPALVNTITGPVITPNMVDVQRSGAGDQYLYKVKFTVPNVPGFSFYLVKIYGTQIVDGERVSQIDYPFLKGNWKPGDSVSFERSVPKQQADSSAGWHLTFCVGSELSCYPSPNLLDLASRH